MISNGYKWHKRLMGQLQVLLREYIDTEMDAKMEQEQSSHLGYTLAINKFLHIQNWALLSISLVMIKFEE